MFNFMSAWLASKRLRFRVPVPRLSPKLVIALPPTPALKPPPPPRPPSISAPRADTTLYVVLPYFNYCKFERRRTLFLEFVARYANAPNVALVVIEALEHAEGTEPIFDLPANMAGVFLHFRVTTKDPIWLKENLINIAVARLPPDWLAMAWVDADLTFLSPSWAIDTLAALVGTEGAAQTHIVQLFQTCCSLGPEGEVIQTDKGFAYQHATSGQAFNKGYRYGFWHPGYAWACSRRAYDAMGGLVDWNLLGSGDHHMALAWIGQVDQSYPGTMHGDFKGRLLDYQERCRAAALRMSYIKGTVLHHWHGRTVDRKYVERWQVLIRHQYNPSNDIARNMKNGLYYLTTAGKRMVPDFRLYYKGRDEDRASL